MRLLSPKQEFYLYVATIVALIFFAVAFVSKLKEFDALTVRLNNVERQVQEDDRRHKLLYDRLQLMFDELIDIIDKENFDAQVPRLD